MAFSCRRRQGRRREKSYLRMLDRAAWDTDCVEGINTGSSIKKFSGYHQSLRFDMAGPKHMAFKRTVKAGVHALESMSAAVTPCAIVCRGLVVTLEGKLCLVVVHEIFHRLIGSPDAT